MLSESLTNLVKIVRAGSRGSWAKLHYNPTEAYSLSNDGAGHLRLLRPTGELVETFPPSLPLWAIAGRLERLGVR